MKAASDVDTSGGFVPVYKTTKLSNSDDIYKLALVNGRYVFNHSDGTATVAPYRAYLSLPSSEVKGELSIAFPTEETTGIDTTISAFAEGDIYTLQGARLSRVSSPGVYIINGKKVLVK